MKACANNTNAVTVNIINNFDVVAIFENLNQEWVRKKSGRLKIPFRIPTVKLKIPGKAFLKSESRTSVTFKLVFEP